MTTLFKGLSVATEIMIKNKYVEILTDKKKLLHRYYLNFKSTRCTLQRLNKAHLR